MIFFKLKTFISRSNLNGLSSSFFFTKIHIFLVENDSAIKKVGSYVVLGW